MSGSNKRTCLRPRPPARTRSGPSATSVILYTAGKTITRKEDRHTLQSLLDQFHSDEAQVTFKGNTLHLQDLCRDVNTNATRYLKLDDSVEDLGQRYIAVEEVPRGTLLATYFGCPRTIPAWSDGLSESQHGAGQACS